MKQEYIYSNELYHFGIPGMKWGVRRARNDGSPKFGLKKNKTQKETIKKILTPDEQAKRKARIKKGFSIAGKVTAVIGTLVAAEYLAEQLTGGPKSFNKMSTVTTGKIIVNGILNKPF